MAILLHFPKNWPTEGGMTTGDLNIFVWGFLGTPQPYTKFEEH